METPHTKEDIESFLQDWQDGKRDKATLAALYSFATGKDLEDCPKCTAKAVTELQKYLHFTYPEPVSKSDRKYQLKPGVHAFAPNSKATHTNGNTTDAQIEWYLEHYPHISQLLA